MKFFAASDVGQLRNMNQDYYYASKELEYSLFILADGMGGYNGGEIASKLATEAVVEFIKENFPKTQRNKESIMELISFAIKYSNEKVFELGKKTEGLELMGTTLEICLIHKERAYIGHIGDSRIYRLRQGILRRLTLDHSYIQKLVTDGTITKEEAEFHPKKNMLIKALGCEANIEPDIMVKGFKNLDKLLICSDGLTNMIPEDEIKKIITENSAEDAINLLIKIANEYGGKDNITAILVESEMEG